MSAALPEPPAREYPAAPIVGVGAVIVHHGKVLLVCRGHEPLKGCWSLPGGALELGETIEQGIVREVREETGLTVKPLEIVATFDRIHRDETGRVQYHYVLIDFLCTVIGGVLAPASDADEARWAAHEELNSHGRYALEPFTVHVLEKAWAMAQKQGLQ